mgnify:CR=1 FL=1
MIPDHPPIAPTHAAVATLPASDRELLHLLLSGSSQPLPAIAQHCGTDLLGLAERILAEPFQAALAAIEHAAAAIARARALVSGAAAVSALTAAATAENPSLADRRRTGAAILRYAPRPTPTPAAANEKPVVTETIETPAACDAPVPAAASVPSVPSPSPSPPPDPIALDQHTSRRSRDRPVLQAA